jgi:uracil-DNA glycosylase
VRKGEPQSHANKGWEIFTDRVIEQINQLTTPVVFLLWGSRAQTKKLMIDTSRHLVLEAPHPSPLSAHRGFFGCKHFSKSNDYLVQSNLSPIEW